jgi:putative addiction module killer protein
MMEIIQSETFRRWAERLRDRRAQAFIAARLLRLSRGMFGDTAPVGDGVCELRIHFWPGYRLYFLRHGTSVIVLLCGGDKSSKTRDISVAKRLAREWRQDHG